MAAITTSSAGHALRGVGRLVHDRHVGPAGRAIPDQLVAALAAEGRPIELVANLGVNGFTSGDLIREELPPLDALAPDFVTVLIGVNDVVQASRRPRTRRMS